MAITFKQSRLNSVGGWAVCELRELDAALEAELQRLETEGGDPGMAERIHGAVIAIEGVIEWLAGEV